MAHLPEDLLRSFLAGRDFECPICGYNIRDLQTDICPECGRQIQLQVGAVEPRQALCIAGLIGLAVGAGFSGLLVVYIGVSLLFKPYRHLPPQFAWVTIVPFLVEATLVGLWLWNWKRIRRMSRLAGGPLVLAAWLISLANVVVFTLNLG